jgi:hypothetical protein
MIMSTTNPVLTEMLNTIKNSGHISVDPIKHFHHNDDGTISMINFEREDEALAMTSLIEMSLSKEIGIFQWRDNEIYIHDPDNPAWRFNTMIFRLSSWAPKNRDEQEKLKQFIWEDLCHRTDTRDSEIMKRTLLRYSRNHYFLCLPVRFINSDLEKRFDRWEITRVRLSPRGRRIIRCSLCEVLLEASSDVNGVVTCPGCHESFLV